MLNRLRRWLFDVPLVGYDKLFVISFALILVAMLVWGQVKMRAERRAIDAWNADTSAAHRAEADTIRALLWWQGLSRGERQAVLDSARARESAH